MKRHEVDMEKSGPRVYVPLALPEATVPTYAVLEFLGFSSPAMISHPYAGLPPPPPPPPALGAVAASASASASASPPPLGSHTVLCLPSVSSSPSSSTLPSSSLPSLTPLTVNSVDSLALHHYRSPPFSLPPHFPITHHIGPDSLPKTSLPQGLHFVWPSSVPDSARGDSPPSSPSTITRAGFSSNGTSRESRDFKDKKSFSVKASPMKKAGVGGVMSSPPVTPTGKKMLGNMETAGVVPTRISVSQTERETVVHTHSSNFREVVHQLTGASSDDQDLLPVTLPARLANRSSEGGGKQEHVGKPETGGQRSLAADSSLRKPPLKLHERRKNLRNLEKLSTAYGELPPLVPSPVTPLASDFEKFCTATTPTGSQGSATISPGRDSVCVEQQAAAASVALAMTAEKGFYMPPQRPPKSGPTLLNLFPESPVCSPREL